MVRRQRVQLLETIERSPQIYGPIGARYNDQDKMWRWPNGARLRVAYLERDADADADEAINQAAEEALTDEALETAARNEALPPTNVCTGIQCSG